MYLLLNPGTVFNGFPWAQHRSIGHIEYLPHFSINLHQIFYGYSGQHSEHNRQLFLCEKYGTRKVEK